MTRLLIVHHTPSPATAELLDSVVSGAQDPEIGGVEVVCRAALAATASDLLAADGVILGTPANIGYMSGALKHFFDQVFYVCAADTRGLPYGAFVHGNSKQLRRRYCAGGWWPGTTERVLFSPAKVSTTRYCYRGAAIPAAWPVTG